MTQKVYFLLTRASEKLDENLTQPSLRRNMFQLMIIKAGSLVVKHLHGVTYAKNMHFLIIIVQTCGAGKMQKLHKMFYSNFLSPEVAVLRKIKVHFEFAKKLLYCRHLVCLYEA